jgi:hypothetical protein
MMLPIRYPAPEKDKYIDEETLVFNRWFIFGGCPATGFVDIADANTDILTHVPPARARKIVEARDIFIDTMLDLIR